MKKKIWLIVLAFVGCLIFAVAGCARTEAEKISVSITNKEALTAEWTEEGENRTVELSITPDKYTVNNSEVVVTSDNSNVVKADGLTLSATGGGTANITVSLGKASDTVAITVTPKLRGVSITNKDELGEVWGLGEADRTLDVAKLFKNSTAPLTASDVTVTSSAPEIIEADGFALKAKAIGDAEITVTYGDFTDKVSLSVVPALETFEIINKGELANLALGTTYDLSSYVTFSPSQYTAENTRPVITCEPAGIIEQVKGYQIKAASNGSATVTVTVRGKSDTFSVSVAYGSPEITFDVDEVGARFEETYEGGILSVLQTGYYNGETDVVLPTVYAMTSDGNYINDIVIKKGEDVITENTVKLTKGTYQLTYSAADPRDNSKVATKTLTVNVYRNVMAAGDANGFTLAEETRYSADENQVLKNNGNGYVTARLNMDLGKVYYTEATFVLSAYNSNPNYGGSPVLGMAHYLGNGNGRRLSLVIGRASGNVFIRVANAGDNYYDNPIRQITNIKDAFSLTAPEGYVFPKDESAEAGKKVKIAIARDGDYFYLFMNDQLIDMRTVSGFEDDTVPAITGDRLSETTMENIVMLDGDAARNKINTFTIPGVEITNKDSLKADWTNKYAKRTVEAQITDLQSPCQGVVKFTVTSDNPDVISVDDDGVTLKAHKNGEATIKVSVGNKFDTVKITVELPTVPAGTPVIEFIRPEDENVKFEETEDGATLGVVQTGYYNADTTVTLPIVTAMLDDTDISDSMTVTLDGTATTLAGNTVTLANGMHTITYTATNADGNKSVTKTLTINVYRKIFSYKGPNQDAHPEWDCIVSKEYVSESEQEVTTTSTNGLRGVFNMAPSTLYYAEVTFVLPAYVSGNNNTNPIIGLGHYVAGNNDRRLSCIIGSRSGLLVLRDFTEGDGYCWDTNIDRQSNVDKKTSLKEKDGYVFPANTSAEAGAKVKLAIARSGNIYYLFLNGVLIEEMDMTAIANGYYVSESVPGISAHRVCDTTMTDIRFFGGDEAQQKINGLIPTPGITNKKDFENEIDQTFKGKVEVTVTPDYYNNDSKVKCTFTSSDENIVTVGEDGTLTAIANGEATITVTIGNKSDSVTVTVKLKADTPVLTLTAPADADNVKFEETVDGATLDVVQTGYYNADTAVTLPQVIAKLGDADISDSITVTLDGTPATLTGNTVALSKGAHTITYTATNNDDTKSVTKTLTINVYRKIFSYKGPNAFLTKDDGTPDPHPEWDYMVSTEFVDDENQVVNVGSGLASRSIFNMAPSKLYYAEVTFVLPAYSSSSVNTNPIMGLGHFVGEENLRRLSCVVGRSSGNIFVTDYESGNIWDNPIGGSYNVNTKTSLTEKDGYVFPANTSDTEGLKVKIAIARSGSVYYLFINDVLMEARDMTGIADGYYLDESVPGISGDRLINCDMVDVDFFGGSAAQGKIDGLLPTPEITNKSAFADKIDQTFTGKVEVTVTPNYYNNDDKLKCLFKSSNESAVAVGEDGTITAIANGEATITVTIGGKSDSVNITVELKADTPILTLTAPADGNVEYTPTEDGATLEVVQTGYYNADTVVTLPQVIAKLGDADISDSITVTLDGTPATLTGNTVALSKGAHTITYTATNNDDIKSVTKTLTINVYRKIFSYKGPNQDAHPEWDCVVSKENAADSAQEVTTTSTSRLRGVFNMAPSTLYYAEVTFILSAHDGDQGNPIIGLGHYVAKDNANNARRLSCVVGRASGTIFVADFTEGNGNIWDNPIGGSYNISTKTSLKEKDGYVFPANTSGTAGAKVKYAVARSGNTYYLFINDVLMEARDMTNVASGYYLNESVPGISGDRLSKTTITDINFFGGDEAQEKINSLTAATTTQSASVQRSPEAIVNKKEEE